MSTGNGLYWLGAWIVIAPLCFLADMWMAAGMFVLALGTFIFIRRARLPASHEESM